jgi:uncharacterized protein YgiM (DUF1202 family)
MKKIVVLILSLMILTSQIESRDSLNAKEGIKKYNHPIEKEGIYRGKLISWNIIYPHDPNIPSGGNPYFYLRIKTKSGKILDSEFYTLKFKRNGRLIADSNRCNGSQVEIHNCKYNMHKKYLKKGKNVKIKIICGEDMGCYAVSIDFITKHKKRKAKKIQAYIPVKVGGEPDLDACAGGIVQGLSKNGFLAVRSGPSTRYRMLDKLHNGDMVFTCDSKGKWIGIVYGKDTCKHKGVRLSSPYPKREKYQGSCNSGWVYNKWLFIID